MRSQADQKDRLARALLAIKDLRAQLDEARRFETDPIAIIGLGCRYPGGVNSPEDFWRLLCDKRDAIREVPAERFDIDDYYDPDPDAAGKICTRSGGFIEDISRFDPQFFGISPREAVALDPQQRLLLEAAWESIERAGIAAETLRGSRTGVFIGISSGEYAQMLLAGGVDAIDSYLGSGNAHSTAAGRLSYVFGFVGPCVALDTACSSSLVAIHLACQSLRTGESELALAGGVNALLTPFLSVNHSRAKMLSPDGRCKAFDASADGFSRAEGCGMVLLKRLSRAVADGDPVLALIRGTAVNQDGHSSGLTVPNGPSQQAVIRQALAQARIDPAQLDFVEAHGTGTALGDPIELNALAAVFGAGRDPGRPLYVGSVKTNIGHAEAAAGVAGLIKAVLCLQHEAIAPNLHFHQPNPRLDWSTLAIRVPTETVAWPITGRPRLVGVSSFGFGGTNAHAILAEAPVSDPPPSAPERPSHVLTLTARSEGTLQQVADRTATHLAHAPGLSLRDLCHVVNAGRSPWRHRLTVIGDSLDSLKTGLAAFVAGQETGTWATSKASTSPRVAFLFTGQGSQVPGMGRALFDLEPAFHDTLLRCEQLLMPHLPRPLLEVMFSDPADPAIHETRYTQPALFALEYSLAQLWISWGVRPSVLIGHSVGEYAAACVAGVFSLEDAITLIAARGRLMQALPPGGGMASVYAGVSEVSALLATLAPQLSIGAINGPGHTVISGALEDVERITAHLLRDGIQSRHLQVSHAFHSALLEPMLNDFATVAGRVRYAPPRLELVSNLTGTLIGAGLARPDYWVQHARQPVLFEAGIKTLAELRPEVLIEVGPHPHLIGMGRPCAGQLDAVWLPSLRRGGSDWSCMLEALAASYRRGVSVDWRSFYHNLPRPNAGLPTYPFERERYWPDPRPVSPPFRTEARDQTRGHPLLGRRLYLADRPSEVVFESQLDADHPPFLSDHRVFDSATLPASAYLEMALAAGRALLADTPNRLSLLSFHQPLSFPGGVSRVVQTRLTTDETGIHRFTIHSRPELPSSQPAWCLHASGQLQHVAGGTERLPLSLLQERIASPLPVDEFYEAYQRLGVSFGPAFRAVVRVWRNDREALGEIRLPDAAGSLEAYVLHPVLLDAGAQVLGAAVGEADGLRLQVRLRRVSLAAQPEGRVWAYAKVRSSPGAEILEGDVTLLNDAGNVLAEVLGQESQHLSSSAEDRTQTPARFYTLRWMKSPREEAARLGDTKRLADALQLRLEQEMASPRLIDYGDGLLELERLAPSRISRAFRLLGWDFSPGDRFRTGDVRDALQISPHFLRLLERLLQILAEEGSLRSSGSDWECVRALAEETPPVPGGPVSFTAEKELFELCTSRLAEVLRGRIDPLQLLFADGDSSLAERCYRDAPGAAVMNGLLREAVGRLLSDWPRGRPLRVLEIGAGTGGATTYVLSALPPSATYVFTDVSRRFLNQARERFASHPGMRYALLDIEQSPRSQGFVGGEFDLVVAFNVLHATRDLHQTLGHVHELLAPAGVMLLLENTATMRWVDLIWGLTPGWWRFEDHELRRQSPLLPAEVWCQTLGRRGFEEAEVIALPAGHHAILSRQSLILARKTKAKPGVWLLVGAGHGLGDRLGRILEDHGHTVRRTSSLSSAEGIGREADDDLLLGVIDLSSLEATPADDPTVETLAEAALRCSGSVLRQARRLARAGRDARLWVITRGAQAVGRAHPLALAQACVWGIGKTLARELPQHWGGLLDLSPEPDPAEASRIIDELLEGGAEDLLAWRDSDRFVARVEACIPIRPKVPPVRSEGVYLVTGGTGALGLEAAHWLVKNGARDLALLSRSGPTSDAARRAIEEWRQAGVNVRILQADVADQGALQELLEPLKAAGLRGLIHAAGLPGFKPLLELETTDLQSMYAAKVAGAWALHRLTLDAGLDFFVCCSSMVSLWGASGQAHYVAANQFLDALALHRYASGLVAQSIDWGPLLGGGMLQQESIEDLKRLGVSVTPLERAGAAFSALVGSDHPQVAVVEIDWPTFRGAYESRGRCHLFDLLQAETRSAEPSPGESASTSSSALAQMSASERREQVALWVRQGLSQVLGISLHRLKDPGQGFHELGLDSLTAMELRNHLQSRLAVSLPATLAFDYPTVDGLTDFLLRERLEAARPAPASPSPGSLEAAAVPPSTPVSSPWKLARSAEPTASSQEKIRDMSDEDVERLLLERLNS